MADNYCKEKKIVAKEQDKSMYYETSAKDAKNVNEAFTAVAQMALENNQPGDDMQTPYIPENNIDLSAGKDGGKDANKGCAC
jgi:hypothetical protein